MAADYVDRLYRLKILGDGQYRLSKHFKGEPGVTFTECNWNGLPRSVTWAFTLFIMDDSRFICTDDVLIGYRPINIDDEYVLFEAGLLTAPDSDIANYSSTSR